MFIFTSEFLLFFIYPSYNFCDIFYSIKFNVKDIDNRDSLASI